jgi:hypothetical protein
MSTSRRSYIAMLALLAGVAGCSDRAGSGPTAPADPTGASAAAATPGGRGALAGRAAEQRLARRMALALADPAFRAYVKGALDRSPILEHKVHLQRLLRGPDRRAIEALARAGGEAESSVDADASAATALELYIPVAAHRAAWRGGDDILVATARDDDEAPVAFDVRGKRRLLSPDAPPSEPVLAVVPVETDFDAREVGLMLPGDGAGGGGAGGGGTPTPNPTPSPPPGLYMSSSHFVQDFEGWLKGSPEYEIHVLGQSGASDSLTSYQCAGEHAAAGYVFDQNSLDWTGNVLLFNQTQLNSYKAAHPNQNVRIVALEDDDDACHIRLDGNRFKTLQVVLQNAYPDLTGGKDTTSALSKTFRRANALQRILRAAYSWLTSQDDLIGNAIEDTVVNEYHAGANWVVRGDNNVTNGWLKLQMR